MGIVTKGLTRAWHGLPTRAALDRL